MKKFTFLSKTKTSQNGILFSKMINTGNKSLFDSSASRSKYRSTVHCSKPEMMRCLWLQQQK